MQSPKHLWLVIFIGHDSWGDGGDAGLFFMVPSNCRPLAHRKVQCLGLGLVFSVYGLFLVINLKWEGRVIAGC